MAQTWKTYAYILGDTVIDIRSFCYRSLESAQSVATVEYYNEVILVDITRLSVHIGDIYRDGVFWTGDGTELVEVCESPSEEDRIEAVENTSTANTSGIELNTTAIDDILVMLLDDTSTTEAME